jgi:hypothetical protein
VCPGGPAAGIGIAIGGFASPAASVVHAAPNRAGDTPRRPSTGTQPTKSSSTNKSCSRSRINIAGVPFELAAHATRAVSTGTSEPDTRPIDILLSQRRSASEPGIAAPETNQPTKITNSIRTSCQSQTSKIGDKGEEWGL